MAKDNNVNLFNGVGFHTWQVKVKGYLMKKGLWSMITFDGKNLTVQQQRERMFKDKRAFGILLTSVADEIIHYLDQATSAKEAWEILEKTFRAKSKHSRILLKMQLYSLTMHDGEPLLSLINHLKSICTQPNNVDCNIDKEDKIALLLKSLPIEYDNIITVLKEKEPIPSLDSIIHSLQEEDAKHLHKEVIHNQALYVSTSKNKACKHCGKSNHSSLNCFKIKKCAKCGKMGHSPQFCKKR